MTTSLDTRYQGAAGACARFEAEVQRHYTGRFAWQLDLERGWEHTRLVRELAPDVAAALNTESAATSPRNVIDIGPHVRALLIGPLDPSLVFVMSRDAGANNLDGPYLDALSDYLARDPVIGRKPRASIRCYGDDGFSRRPIPGEPVVLHLGRVHTPTRCHRYLVARQ